jgi:hypothetical protein
MVSTSASKAMWRRFAGLLLLGLPLSLPAESPHEGLRVVVSDAQTQVLLAGVFLTIGELTWKDSALVGDYDIRVPLRPSKGDRGSMRLPYAGDLDALMRDGGLLEGTGISVNEEAPKRIIQCKVVPTSECGGWGRLELVIDAGKRILEFSTDYRLVLGGK